VKASWRESFFSYFYSLITDTILKNHLSAVMTTTPKYYHDISVCHSVLTLTPSDKATIHEMVQKGFTRNIEQLTTEVFEKTGGHPFLVQYVLYELYGEQDRTDYDIEALVKKCPAQL
jgi:hypothetical protein